MFGRYNQNGTSSYVEDSLYISPTLPLFFLSLEVLTLLSKTELQT